MSSRTFIAREEKPMSGFKPSLTLFGTNAENPRTLKNNVIYTLPVFYE